MPRGRRGRIQVRPPPLALLALLLLAGCLDPIPPGTLVPGDGVIEGTVRRRCGAQPPLAGAQVALDGVVRAHTDATGAYRIEGVRADREHTMAADLAGYVHTETVVRVSAGDATVQNFALEAPGDERSPVLLDVLFVIDDSLGMAPWQDALVRAFPALAARLAGGSLNLHLGIVTTDVGAGPTNLPACVPGGDRGLLQLRARGATCDRAALLPTSGARYLGLVRDSSGAESANFSGTLDEAFACYAPVGEDGCGFGMPLEAMSRALDPRLTENGDFLRDGATLLVIVVTDGDDCSAPASTDLFDPFQTDPLSPLGPLTTYRCFEFGVTCGGQPPGRTAGVRTDCLPGDPDPAHRLASVGGYADLLRASHGGRVVLGVVAGPSTPVEVALDADGFPRLAPPCLVGGNGPTPAIRLAALAASMPQTNVASICGDRASPGDYSAGLAFWAQQALDLAVASRTCE